MLSLSMSFRRFHLHLHRGLVVAFDSKKADYSQRQLYRTGWQIVLGARSLSEMEMGG
jgi:hypothetical protein